MVAIRVTGAPAHGTDEPFKKQCPASPGATYFSISAARAGFQQPDRGYCGTRGGVSLGEITPHG
ncbi:hypothetical protein [Azoarcus sp. DN11]|uniref:hypothetical protein n=1 Tax=Azoarcus sp. DN11 TaxID=356837 RepID=UPI000FE26FBB|nr:hypothetical protein [Azoarcus sp. DN11]